MDDLNIVYHTYREASIKLKAKCTVHECPTCHKFYNVISNNNDSSICLNCGRTYFKENNKNKVFEGMGLFMVIRGQDFTIGAIPKDKFDESYKNLITMCYETFKDHPNKCDYFILHQYKDNVAKNIDFKDML